MILHCMTKTAWEEIKHEKFWGHHSIEMEGFIHCSSVEYFWRVAPNFKDVKEVLVIVCLDEAKLTAEVRYEDGDNCGRYYPHIYGLVNNDAVVAVLPFNRDENGVYIKNSEFAHIENK